MRLLLIRHCQSMGPAPDAALTPEGVLDAWALVGRLEHMGVDAVYSSPYARALGTITPFVVAGEADLAIEPRLRERAVQMFADRTAWLAHIRRAFAEPHYKLDGEESMAEAAARGLSALAEIAAAGHRLPALVSHGQVMSAVLSAAPGGFGYDGWTALANPDLVFVDWRAGGIAAIEKAPSS